MQGHYSLKTFLCAYVYTKTQFFNGFSLFSWFFMFLFKELDFKELEIHRYSLLDTTNEYQWISINEFIDGPSMNMVPFLWAPFFGPIGPPLGPMGPAPFLTVSGNLHPFTNTICYKEIVESWPR